jgi:ketosteroid isomerase-like protein
MSQENVALARQLYDAWNRGDLDLISEHLTDDFELRPFLGFLDVDEVYRGREGWDRFAHSWLEAWEAAPIEIDRIEDLGERVLTLLTFNATGRGSGVSVPMKFGQLATIRDGRVASLVVIEGWERALEVAGLRE